MGKVFLTEEYQLTDREEGMDFGNYQCMWHGLSMAWQKVNHFDNFGNPPLFYLGLLVTKIKQLSLVLSVGSLYYFF